MKFESTVCVSCHAFPADSTQYMIDTFHQWPDLPSLNNIFVTSTLQKALIHYGSKITT